MPRRRVLTVGRLTDGRSPGRSCWVVAVTLLMSIGLALPAAADPPVTDTFSVTFDDLNPCSPTGEFHEVTINFEDRIHFHQNNFVLTSKRTGTTDSGFVMVNGTEHIVETQNVFAAGFTDVWSNPTTGERFIASGTFVFNGNTGTVQVDDFSLRCLG